MKKTKKSVKVEAKKVRRRCVRCGARGFNSRTCGGTKESHSEA